MAAGLILAMKPRQPKWSSCDGEKVSGKNSAAPGKYDKINPAKVPRLNPSVLKVVTGAVRMKDSILLHLRTPRTLFCASISSRSGQSNGKMMNSVPSSKQRRYGK